MRMSGACGLTSLVKKHVPLIKFRSQLKNCINISRNPGVLQTHTNSAFVVKSSVPPELAVEHSFINPKFRRKRMTDEEIAFYEVITLYL
ncbi:hypothetical protein KSF78_0000453 [Schistosoma japonicum]|nr:hypothetical protein KSF78_0000453 [Schistosoma japonicum]